MLFNSLDFALFLPIVFILYWFVVNRSIRLQNMIIVVASYVFYGWWDWRFLSLILFSTIVDYFVGRKLLHTSKKKNRKLLLWLSISVNIGFLGFFKYYNFFLDNFVEAFSFFGYNFSVSSLNIILPVGISFYTFQTLSYTIDVYRRNLEPTKDFVAFSAFVSFFPQLVAGPIERASNLLPQFYRSRYFDHHLAVDGMRQILWGLFKKVVIADNSARIVNEIFANYPDYNGSTLLLGSIFFAFQIYGDFSGYSDIAIGTSRLFGFNLKRNFAYPYFSRDIAEFWRRWHISLSTWFRDYVYIPLGGSRGGNGMRIRNTFVIFIVSGFWHGANWTFIIWGALNAIYFLPLLLKNKNRVNTDIVAENRKLPSVKEVIQILVTFFITLIAWIFFRSDTVADAFTYIQLMFTSLISAPEFLGGKTTLVLIAIMVIVEWVQRKKQHALEFNNAEVPKLLRWSIYLAIVALMLCFSGDKQEFIYFQF